MRYEQSAKIDWNRNKLPLISIKACSINRFKLTFLKTSRLHAILPKHSSETDCCVLAKIIGSIRWISIGNKCQSNTSIVKSIFSNASLSRWPSSQSKNTVANAKIPFKNSSNEGIIFSWSNWNRDEIVEIEKATSQIFKSKCIEYSTICIWMISIPMEIAKRHQVKTVANRGCKMSEISCSTLKIFKYRRICSVCVS